MKRNKLKLFGIIAAVAVIGLSMASCGGDDECLFGCVMSRPSTSTFIPNPSPCERSDCRVARIWQAWLAFLADNPGNDERMEWLDNNGLTVGTAIRCDC